jgi:hypothetical protein
VITQGEWTPPAGVRQVSKAEKDLIYAQAAVDDEKADASELAQHERPARFDRRSREIPESRSRRGDEHVLCR